MKIDIKSKYKTGQLLYYSYIPPAGSGVKFPHVRMDIKMIDIVQISLTEKDEVIISYNIQSIVHAGFSGAEWLTEKDLDKAIKKKVIFINIKDWEQDIKYKTNAVKKTYTDKRIECLKNKLDGKFNKGDE